MKIRMTLALIMIFSAFAVVSIIIPAPVKAQLLPCPDPDVVGLWHMSENTGGTIKDETQNHNDGIIHGAQWVEGKFGSGLYFDGNAYVDLGNGPNLNYLKDFTIEAWIKPSPDSLTGRPAGFAQVISKYGLYSFDINIWYGHLFGAFGLGYWYWTKSVPLLEADTWTYVAFTHQYNGHVRKLYINGVEVPTVQGRGFTGGGFGNLYFGVGSPYTPPHTFQQAYIGVLDEVRITKRVLSAEEITGYYNSNNEYCAIKIAADVNIDPDTLNLKSKGKWITGYIELPEGYDVDNIDVSTILLNDVVYAELEPSEIGDYDDDGTPDLMVKFDRDTVQDMLEVGDGVGLTVTGELTDGTSFEGTDAIRVIDKSK